MVTGTPSSARASPARTRASESLAAAIASSAIVVEKAFSPGSSASIRRSTAATASEGATSPEA